ncbi:MAG: hypothetical protein Q9171_003283 [Xanthocarpia ochracea]
MSPSSHDRYNPVSNSAGSNDSIGNDAVYGNTLMDQGFPAFLQPNFGQVWPASQAWNNMPLPSYNFNLPLQSDYSANNGFFQNQQNELPDYDGNDDFYDNEMNQTDNPPKLNPASKQHSSGSLASQNTSVTPTKLNAEATKGPAIDSGNRAAELRAMLLAKKRPGSATSPAPRAFNRENNVEMMDRIEQGNKENGASSVEQTLQPGNTNVDSIETTASRLTDKSSQYPSNAQSLPTQNADIEGLIDEYRASDAVKDLSVSNVSTKTSGTSNGKANGVTNGSHPVGPAIPNPDTTVDPHAKQSGVPGSPESGEIHSDQEPTTNKDQAQAITEQVNNQTQETAGKNVAVDNSDRQQPPKTPQIRTDDSKQATVPSKSRQNSLVQKTDRRKSGFATAETRNIPLAQRITHVRKEEIQSLSLLPDTRNGNNRQPELKMNNVDNRDRQQTAKSFSVVAQSRPQLPSRTATGARPDRHQHERKQNEELAALYKRQLAEQNTPSPRLQAASNEGRKSENNEPATLHTKPHPNGASTDTGVTPTDQHAPEGLTSGTSSSDQEGQSLTQLQLEQIQSMGIDLSPKGLSDLYNFLEYHRFYVEEYREGVFARQTRLRALEAERIALERESVIQFDHFNSMRSQSLAARDHTEPPTPIPVHRTASVEKASTKPMPPPLTLPKRISNGNVGDIPDSAISSKSATRANGEVTPRGIRQPSPSNLKRHRPDEEDVGLGQSKKVARVDTDARSNGKGQDISPRTTGNDQPSHDRRFSSDSRPAGYELRGRSGSPNERRRSVSAHRRASDFGYRSRQNSWAYNREHEYPSSRDYDYRRPSADGLRRDSASTVCRKCDRVGHFTTNCPEERRDGRTQYSPSRPNNDDGSHRKEPAYFSPNHPPFPNRGNRGGSRNGRAGHQNNKARLAFSSYAASPVPSGWKNNTRFFMIKSWNAENVEAAQRDCIWATQPKNLNVLTEAFNKCRNVVLVFSVNNSRAFQGYARMLSLPDPSIPAPSWQRALIWASTDPFRIEWITIAETRFNRVGHLKNACNEGQPVLVGRDGQEIEEGCGRRLCELIDAVEAEGAGW